jgi:hypothetical protein
VSFNIAIASYSDAPPRYTAILSEMKKTDSYLQKLKKGRQGFTSFFGSNKPNEEPAAKEEDRVKAQMQADVQVLVNEASTSLGVAVGACPPLQALLAEAAL